MFTLRYRYINSRHGNGVVTETLDSLGELSDVVWVLQTLFKDRIQLLSASAI